MEDLPASFWEYRPLVTLPEHTETELFFGPKADDTSSIAEDEWLDLPADAHILTNFRSSSIAVLPVICIADSDNIIPLISSVASQRRAWGIDLPVVGLELSEFGSTVRTFISWSGDHKRSEEVVSRPRIDEDDGC